MQVSYVSKLNPKDPSSFSGTPAHMIRALESQGIEIKAVGPLHEPFRAWYTAKHAFYKLAVGKSYARDREPAVLRAYARQVEHEIDGSDVVMSRGSESVAYLECEQPIVMWTDATFASMVGF